MDEGSEWWETGLRFECQGSGKCCVSHGEYGYVYLTLEDRRRLAQSLGLSTAQFTKRHCAKDEDLVHLIDGKDGHCQFLENKKCGVYEARPTQCRTWPFWPEVINAKVWQKEVASFCPGVGKGRTWSADEIRQQVSIQQESEKKL
jgi:Fe-S-cluster containining protein